MSVAISVGPPAITINQGNIFMVTNLRGEIEPYEEHGVFARDTRFISAYRLSINQAPWTLLSSSAITYYSAGFEFVNPTLQTEDGESNAGHCLWSGIAGPERAARVVQRLMQADMSSGWGFAH